MTYQVIAQPLSRQAFLPYGDVIETEGAKHFPINQGTTERYHDLATIQCDAGSRPTISIAKVTVATPLPTIIQRIERHPLASQAFIPLFNTPFTIVVALPTTTNSVQAQALVAFTTNGRQGINYRAGTWHIPLIAPHADSQFMIVDRSSEKNNCEEYFFEETKIRLMQA